MKPRTGLAFVAAAETPSYGAAFSRLRWRRAAPASAETVVRPWDRAAGAFAAADAWVAVLAPDSLPAGGGRFPDVPAGASISSARRSPALAGGAAAHTLRELEEAGGGSAEASRRDGSLPAAIAFRPADFPAEDEERVDAYLSRVAAAARPSAPAGLAALEIPDPSDRERPELSMRIPEGRRRLADVGCGAGATGAAWKRRGAAGDVSVTGIERDESAAARARGRLDRVIVGDAAASLSDLAARGERFDAFLFGDVLEHTGDPAAVLAAARAAASAGAVLVASVPNAGHLSLVRDLALGRFDPVPAGLADAGHLRWFTRSFLEEVLREGGWRPDSVEGITGPPPPGAGAFLDALAGWPGLDPAALMVYQWVAVATAV